MSVQTLVGADIEQRARQEARHRLFVRLAISAAATLIVCLAVYGHDYYLLGAGDRPFSPKHRLLKPSGVIGIKLGMLGVALFCTIFAYAVRKRIGWLKKIGNSRHWMDFHVVAGVTAPLVIAFHSSFKFYGLAGMAFWIMTAVALSGIVGRYLYGQIPRELNAAETSLRQLHDDEARLTRELSNQQLFPASMLERLSHVPSQGEIANMPLLIALLRMVALDLVRPLHVARLRLLTLGFGAAVLSAGGLLPSHDSELERIVRVARRKSALSKRIAFLDRTRQVFHLWHVVHRPFSYSFVVLATIHIVVVLGLGFM